MSQLPQKDLFLQSLNRCSNDENFIPAFYERFFAADPEIRDKFRNTDFEKQNKMLLRSLQLAAGATSGDPDALHEMQERAETHDRHHLNIEPRFYDVWLSCVIATASEFDPKWDPPTHQAWKTILGHVINRMIKSY